MTEDKRPLPYETMTITQLFDTVGKSEDKIRRFIASELEQLRARTGLPARDIVLNAPKTSNRGIIVSGVTILLDLEGL